MARPSKLTPAQWADVERRAAEGESLSALAREFGVSVSTVSARVSAVSETVRNVAHQVAQAHSALAELPARQQHMAVSLADKLRNISASLASAAELGAATAHRLQALANGEVQKIDDAAPLASLNAMKGVKALTDLANGAAAISLNLLAANKETVQKVNNSETPEQLAPVRERLTIEQWRATHGL